MENDNRTGQLIRKYRKDKGYTQVELSQITKIPVTHIRQYEIGYRNPKFETLVLIANALDVSVFEFIDIEIKEKDLVALLKLLSNQNTDIIPVKDESGNISVSTIGIKFSDASLLSSLMIYLAQQKRKHISSKFLISGENGDFEITYDSFSKNDNK